jgi:hypothetical protein
MSKKKKDKSLVWDGMTKKQHGNISQYVGKMAATLGLVHWKLKLADEFCEEDGNPDALATLQVMPGRHYGLIRLSKDFNTFPYDEKKQALIHELVHCHQQRLLLWADDTLREALGSVAHEILWAAYRDNFEHMVDDLSVVLARLVDDSSCAHLLKGK